MGGLKIFLLMGSASLLIFGCEMFAPESREERTVSPELCQPKTVSPGSRVATYTRSFIVQPSLEPEGEIHIIINYAGLSHGKLRFTYDGEGHHLHPPGTGPAEANQVVWGHNVGFPYSIRVVAISGEKLTYYLEPAQGCPEPGD
jgi:hypothetical protein